MDRLASLRAELSAASRLAAPVALVQLGMMLMGVVDTIMLGHLSAGALAAGALGHMVTITLLMMGYGVLSALDPLVSQAHGAGDARAVGDHLQRGLVMAAALTLPFVLVSWDIRGLLRVLGQHEEVIGNAAAYARAIIWGSLPYFLFVVLRQTLQAMSVVRQAAVAIVVGNVANALANYILIFGHFGAPALGVAGSAYSTSIARWLMFLYLLAASRHTLARFWRGFTAEALAMRGYQVMLRIGVPIGFHNSVELLVFVTVAFLMGRMGVHELAGHQIAINLASLSFMVPLGISGAAATRVGNAIGRGDLPGARRAAAACLLLGGGVMVVFALVFGTVPEALSRLYTRDAGVVAMASALIPIAAAFQVFDGVQVVGAGVLRGAADTAFPAGIALVGFWAVGLPLGWVLGFPARWGPRGLWWGLTAGLAAVAILFLARIAVRFRDVIGRVGAEAHP
ncbi:MAG TPA: MATE family efflux transporter [Thermoanaerobaculia bacterium]|jgi:MATE family multidrug resistance protein|nr:MATE family efflux transporter [Thermoanaerobaculia bacterium]